MSFFLLLTTETKLGTSDGVVVEVSSGRGGELVEGHPAVPDGALALDDGDDLLCEADGELVLAGAARLLLVDRVEDPADGDAPAGPGAQGRGDLERVTTTGRSLEVLDPDQWRDALHGQGQVQQRVQGKLGGRRGAREQRADRVDLGGRRGSEVVQYT